MQIFRINYIIDLIPCSRVPQEEGRKKGKPVVGGALKTRTPLIRQSNQHAFKHKYLAAKICFRPTWTIIARANTNWRLSPSWVQVI